MDIEMTSVTPVEIIKGYTARFIHTKSSTLAFWDVKAGAVMPEHTHVHEQTSQVLSGKFELIIDGIARVYEPGTVAVIPSFVKHGGRAITNSKLLDTFTPVREDYKLK